MPPAEAISEEMSAFAELKRQVDDSLVSIERQIYDLEENYIEETSHGNVMNKWVPLSPILRAMLRVLMEPFAIARVHRPC